MGRSKALRGGTPRREYWQAVLARQRECGLSIKAFCVREGVAPQSFFYWKRRFRDGAAPAPGKVTFASVTVVPETLAAGDGCIAIVLPGNRRVHVHGPIDRKALADVLAVLGASEGAAAC